MKTLPPIISFLARCVLVAAIATLPAYASLNVSVNPGFTTLHTGQTLQLTPLFSTGVSSPLNWAVDGITGGNATFGTISATGVYQAPALVPAGSTVTITAIATTGSSVTSATVAVVTGLDHYVSTSGSDSNPGTLGAPWRTIQYASTKVSAGDTVFVRSGIYHETVSLVSSGSAAAGPIVFQGYPGERPIVDGTGVACCGGTTKGLFTLRGNLSYIIIEGFELRNFTSTSAKDVPAGIFLIGAGANISILNNNIHAITEAAGVNGQAIGIGVTGVWTTPYSNIAVSHNQIYGMLNGRNECLYFDGNVSGFSAIGNVIHDNNSIALDMIGYWGTAPAGYDQARNGKISGNTIYNNSALNNPSFYGYDAGGIYCDGCTNVLIEHNTVYNNDLNIIAASENLGRTSSYVTVRNNLIYNPNAMAVSIGGYSANNGGSDHITIVNNTILASATKNFAGSFQVGHNATNNSFQNNLVYGGVAELLLHGYANSTTAPVTADYNIYYTSGPVPKWYWQGVEYTTLASYQAASGQDKNSSIENPMLTSPIAPYNFHLQVASPALSKGNFGLGTTKYGTTDYGNNPRISANAINIGAYQK